MRPLAPAIYRGPQKDLTGKILFHWWDLTAGIPGHPAESTVADITLLAEGFRLPCFWTCGPENETGHHPICANVEAA